MGKLRCALPCDYEELASGVFRCRRCDHMHSTNRYREPEERDEAERAVREFEATLAGKRTPKLIIPTRGIRK
jgi:hypothetical protein